MIVTVCNFQRVQSGKWEAGLAIDGKNGWEIFDRNSTLVVGEVWDLVIKNNAYFTLDVSPILDQLQDILDERNE